MVDIGHDVDMKNKYDTEFISLPIDEFVEDSDSPRGHPPEQLEKLRASFREYGKTTAVTVDENNRILAGNARISVARELGYSEFPAIRICGLTEEQKCSLSLLDNRITEDGFWIKDKLKARLEFILGGAIEIKSTAFEIDEIDRIMFDDAADTGDDDVPDIPPDYMPVTQAGDIWILGDHRLVCGNSLLPDTYAALMGDEKAEMVFCDPPYNVEIKGHVKK